MMIMPQAAKYTNQAFKKFKDSLATAVETVAWLYTGRKKSIKTID